MDADPLNCTVHHGVEQLYPLTVKMVNQSLSISVTDTTGLSQLRPVTGGVPVPEGAAGEAMCFRLHGAGGEEIPCQSQVLARWEDASAKWVLLDFQADPPARGSAKYELTWAERAGQASPEVPVQVEGGMSFLLSSGSIRISPVQDALFSLSGKARVSLTAEDQEGRKYRAVPEKIEVTTEGPLRSTLCLSGSFRDAEKRRLFGFRMWATAFAGLSRVLLEPMVLMDSANGLVQKIRDLSLTLTPVEGMRSVDIGGDPVWKGEAGSGARLFQLDDRRFVLEDSEGCRAPGWAEMSDGKGRVSLAIRDFWQQWPKSIETDGRSLTIGLLPHFKAGDFDHMLDPWYKHDYLFEGDCYRLRSGQVRRWQVWLDLEGDGDSLAAMANAPLVPSADPVVAAATGVYGSVLPEGAAGMAESDAWMAKLFEAYCDSIESQRDYGAMNWGDWFGERIVNWGNHEYDTPRQFLVQFGRTGDPKYLHLGSTAARHVSEVDVIHCVNRDLIDYFEKELWKDEAYPIRPGMVHEHSIGHVGGFHPVSKIRELYVEMGTGKSANPYLCLDPYNLGHIFTEGMMYNYFLTGDPWAKETLDKIGANLAQLVEDRKFSFTGEAHCGRVTGWTMLALAGIHETSPHPRYLAAMKLLADDALSEQDPNCGGWLYPLPWGHCYCTTAKHVGEAAFLGAIRINGLYRYYLLSGDERIPEAIERGITHLNQDTWDERESGWRYTSCPGTSASISRPGVTILAVTNSIRLTGNEEHLRILRAAWNVLFEQLKSSEVGGKSFSSTLYGCPETMSLLASRREDDR